MTFDYREWGQRLWYWVQAHPWVALAFIVAGIALEVFIELVEELYEGQLGVIDALLMVAIRLFRSVEVEWLSVLLSDLLRWPFVALIVLPFVIYLLCKREIVIAAVFVLVPFATGFFVTLVKILFQRQRPVTAMITEAGNSFPSGHATVSVVLYGLMGYIAWRCWATKAWQRALCFFAPFLLAIGTGYARVYLEVHYPSDVMAGWSAGVLILTGTILLLELHRTHVKYR